jgi:hypothetical protein
MLLLTEGWLWFGRFFNEEYKERNRKEKKDEKRISTKSHCL